VRDHKKLRAFELADEIAVMIYEMTKALPKEELYGLTGQMRRAAVSAASNLVEGCSRNSRIEYLRFLEIAYGSLRELGYQAGLTKRLGMADPKDWDPVSAKIEEAQKVLAALIRSIRRAV
jgi:four helix bundle protein